MIEIALKEIEKYYGANKILENVTFDVQTGEKVGLIGRNGTGKTTIFKIITGMEKYDEGMLAIRKGASMGYLDQIPSCFDNLRVIDVLNLAFEEIQSLEKEIKLVEKQMADVSNKNLAGIIKKYGELVQIFEHKGGYDIEEKISRICTGLKIQEDFRERFFNTLSGGEKTTTLLAKILLQSPDILLLDEPTNHLDMDSIEWFEEFLAQYEGTVIIVSHDRYFLDKAVGKILEVEDGEVNVYEGNYSYYVEEKNRRLTEQFEAFQDQQKKIKAMEKTIKTLKEWGDRGDNPKFHRKAASIQKRLDKMQKIVRPALDRAKIQLAFSGSDRSGKEVIAIKGLSKSFGSKLLLDGINLDIYYGEKTAIIGKNGSGKSTLLKIILYEYQPDNGSVTIGANVNIGYLEQNVYFQNENISVIEAFREDYACTEGQARKILAKFLFYGEDVFKTVKNLSGGEKSRLKLCQLMHQDINLLILDEPTNHLDIDSREMLEDALTDFEGTLLFISHDRYFLNKLAGRICSLVDGKIETHSGNYDYYKQKLIEKLECRRVETTKPENVKIKMIKQPVKQNVNREKILIQLEKEISSLEETIKQKDNEMQINGNNVEILNRLFNEKNILQEELDVIIEEWINYNPS